MGNPLRRTEPQSHDDWLLEGHDEGRDGQGLCPNCQESIADAACRCCPICEGDGRVISGGKYEMCPACEGWGEMKAPEPTGDEP